MEILRLCAIGLITALLSLFLRGQKNPLALPVSLGGGCLLLFYALPYFRDVLGLMGELSAGTGLDNAYVSMLVRIIAVTFLTEICTALCRDAGESALAQTLEGCGKLLILGMSMPVITALFEAVISFLPA